MFFFIRSLVISGFVAYYAWIFQAGLEQFLLKNKKRKEDASAKGKAR